MNAPTMLVHMIAHHSAAYAKVNRSTMLERVVNVEDPNGYINELIKMYSEESYKMSVVAAKIEEAEERLIDCE
jgi:hypothetical protein